MESIGARAGARRRIPGNYNALDYEVLAVAGDVATVQCGAPAPFVTTYPVGRLTNGRGFTFVRSTTPTPEGGTGVPVVGRWPVQPGDVFDVLGTEYTLTGRRDREDRGWQVGPNDLYVSDDSIRSGASVFVRHAATPPPAPVAQPATTCGCGGRDAPGLLHLSTCKHAPANQLPPTGTHATHATFTRGCGPCLLRAGELGPGAVEAAPKPQRYVFVPRINEFDLLPDAQEGWRR